MPIVFGEILPLHCNTAHVEALAKRLVVDDELGFAVGGAGPVSVSDAV